MLLSLLSRVVCTVAGSFYPAYASYKAINSRDHTRLTAWLMYWTVMGIFTLAEVVLDTLVFWLPFYYEIKMLFVLWMILPQTQGSMYLYQNFVDPYLSQHEREIDQTLKDIKKQAMAMGMQYIKQAIQVIQNFALDIYKKSQNQGAASSLSVDSDKPSDRSAPSSSALPHDSSDPAAPHHAEALHPSAAHGYLSWAYHVMSPKLAAAATMASETIARQMPARPLPQPPVNLYAARTTSSGSTSSSREPSISGQADNALGIHSASVSPTERAQLEHLSSRLNAAAQSSAVDSGSLRNRKISLYETDGAEDTVMSSSSSSASTGGGHGFGHVSEESRGSSSYSGLSRPTGPAPVYTP
ncbi:receptor accessory protein 4 [Mortierella alpina]|uniref:Protein YOP1 n=1 Tax=Mortierella alpina TaxID=64518 RepID=A0A9P6IUE1_MORAP|nr:receptor accessory protein 4 [Mortierella alpina]